MTRVGMDIGGTQLRVAAFADDGTIQYKAAIANDHTLGPRQNLDRLIATLEGWGVEYAGIGIGCPGPLDFGAGKILTPPNLPGWENFAIRDYVRESTGHQVALNNDANVAGLAEALVGAGKGCDSVFYFTVSTGVGGAYVYQGQIVGGAHSCAAEVFNLVVNEAPSVRPGMNAGALEDQSSGTAIGRLASEALGRQVDAREVFELAHAGSAQTDCRVARSVVNYAADCLAKGVANVAAVVDPDVFVFGGSVALYNPDFIELVHKKVLGYTVNGIDPRFELAQCGGDAGLVGAALLVG